MQMFLKTQPKEKKKKLRKTAWKAGGVSYSASSALYSKQTQTYNKQTKTHTYAQNLQKGGEIIY